MEVRRRASTAQRRWAEAGTPEAGGDREEEGPLGEVRGPQKPNVWFDVMVWV